MNIGEIPYQDDSTYPFSDQVEPFDGYPSFDSPSPSYLAQCHNELSPLPTDEIEPLSERIEIPEMFRDLAAEHPDCLLLLQARGAGKNSTEKAVALLAEKSENELAQRKLISDALIKFRTMPRQDFYLTTRVMNMLRDGDEEGVMELIEMLDHDREGRHYLSEQVKEYGVDTILIDRSIDIERARKPLHVVGESLQEKAARYDREHPVQALQAPVPQLRDVTYESRESYGHVPVVGTVEEDVPEPEIFENDTAPEEKKTREHRMANKLREAGRFLILLVEELGAVVAEKAMGTPESTAGDEVDTPPDPSPFPIDSSLWTPEQRERAIEELGEEQVRDQENRQAIEQRWAHAWNGSALEDTVQTSYVGFRMLLDRTPLKLIEDREIKQTEETLKALVGERRTIKMGRGRELQVRHVGPKTKRQISELAPEVNSA